MRAKGAVACWLTAGIVYPTFEAIAAGAYPGYRYAHDFISDLGRPDSPLSPLMNAAFVIQGTLFCGGAVLLVRAARKRSGTRSFLVFAAANAVGNIVVASVPSGSAGVAWVHLTGAVLAIVGGNAAALAGSKIVRAAGPARYYRPVAVALGALGLLSFVALAVESTTSLPVGLPNAVWERTSVYTIIGWQVFSAVQLMLHARGGGALTRQR